MPNDVSALLNSTAITNLLIVFLFRLLPFAAYSLRSLRSRPWTSAGFAGGCALLGVAIVHSPGSVLGKIVFIGLGWLYFIALGFSLYHLGQPAKPRPFARWALFVALFALCVAVPAYFLPRNSLPMVLLVAYGFELALAAYSYCHAQWSGQKHPTLSECFFFLFVTPELVFPGKGHWSEPMPLRGLARALVGCVLIALVTTIGRALEPAKPELALGAWKAGVLHGAIGFLQLYATHSGLAHTQIGLCRVLGYVAPERYGLPFLAASPREFWARWNRYMGTWLRTYVHAPLIRLLATRVRFPRFVRSGLATLGAFLWLGAFHDAYWFFAHGMLVTSGMLGFGCWGLMLCVWQPIDSLFASRRAAWQGQVIRQLSRLGTLACLCVTVWAFL